MTVGWSGQMRNGANMDRGGVRTQDYVFCLEVVKKQ